MNSKVGILMPVASLPCRFGSGDFGPDAYRFVDDIAKAGFSIWQILPLNPLGYGNSPYQPFSSYAMDEMYISLNEFYWEIGLDSTEIGDELGWNIDNGLIELTFSSQLSRDGVPCLVVNYRIAPKYGYASMR